MRILLGFFGNPMKYQRIWISFKELDDAYNGLNKNGELDDFEGVCLWHYDSNAFNFLEEYCAIDKSSINCCLVAKKLALFRDCRAENDIWQSQPGMKFGLEAVQTYGIYAEIQADLYDFIEMQPIYVIIDHLKLLKLALESILKREAEDLNDLTISCLEY